MALIDVIGDDVEETTTFRTILETAFDITLKCVLQPPHLGGRARVGQRHMLGVAVLGRASGTLLKISVRLWLGMVEADNEDSGR